MRKTFIYFFYDYPLNKGRPCCLYVATCIIFHNSPRSVLIGKIPDNIFALLLYHRCPCLLLIRHFNHPLKVGNHFQLPNSEKRLILYNVQPFLGSNLFVLIHTEVTPWLSCDKIALKLIHCNNLDVGALCSLILKMF